MKKITCVLLIFLTGCSGAAAKNKWQKQEEFVQRRSIYYNDFVQSGGMIKDEGTAINPVKKEIQNSLNQGKMLGTQP